MIILSETVKTFANFKEISDRDYRLLTQYLFGENVALPPHLQIYAKIAIEDRERIEEAARKKHEAKKEAHAAYMRTWRGRNGGTSCDSCDSSQDSQPASERCEHSNTACDRVPTIPHQPTKPSKPTSQPDRLSDGSTGVSKGGFGKSPFEQGCLSDKVDARTYTAFANKLFDPEEDDASAFSFWVKSFYEGSKTIIFAKWQDYVRKAIKTAREEGHFMPNDSPVDPE